MRNSLEKLKKICFGLGIGLLCAFFASPVAAKVLAADRVAAPESLLPYFSWLADVNGELDIRAVSSEAVQERFAPLAGGIPLRGTGPVWLRLDISRGQPSGMQAAPAARNRLVMRLGQLPPGGAEIFSPEPAAFSAPANWRSERVNSMEEALLPEPGLSPLRVYIRLEEMPGLWFSPGVNPRNAAATDILPSELLLPGIIIAALLACFLRAIAEQSQWALWAALFLGCVLAQSRLPLPLLGRTPLPADLPSLLAPGLSLILLPHVGRRIFFAAGNSLWKNSIFYLCSALGAAIALVPLLSGQLWLARLFPLWPLLLVPLLPVCVSALTARQPGSLAFSGAVAMPVLGAVLALFALKFPDIHPLAAQGGLWGLAVGGLGLALARIPKAARQGGSDLAVSLAEAVGAESFSTLSAQSQYDELPPLEVMRMGDPEAGADVPALPAGDPGSGAEDGAQTEKWEKGVWTKTGAGFSEYPGFAAGRDEEDGMSPGEASPGGEEAGLPPEVLATLRGESEISEAAFIFNIHSLVREVHEMVLPLAKSRGLILSWYIAPVCPALLEGDAPRLRGALALLLQNAVRACVEGVVQLSVRPAPGGQGQGDLLFTISDSGAAKHTDAGFFLAWELSARSGGAFTVDYSPQSGTRIAFTARFAVPSEDAAQTSAPFPALEENFAEAAGESPPEGVQGSFEEGGGSGPGLIAPVGHPQEEAGGADGAEPGRADSGADVKADTPLILLGDMTSHSRRTIAGYLRDFPFENLGECDAEQIRRILQEKTAALLIFDADMPEADIVRSIGTLRAEEDIRGTEPLPVLVIAGHRAQAERLLKAGASHVLGKPFTRQALREQVIAVLPAHAASGAASERTQGQPDSPDLPETRETPAAEAAAQPAAAPREPWTSSYEEERAKVWESPSVRADQGPDLRGPGVAAEETQAVRAWDAEGGREPWSEEPPYAGERRAFADPSIHDLFLDPSIAFLHPGQLAPFHAPRHSTASAETPYHEADAPASGEAAPKPDAAGAGSVPAERTAASEAGDASRTPDAQAENAGAEPGADAPPERKDQAAPGEAPRPLDAGTGSTPDAPPERKAQATPGAPGAAVSGRTVGPKVKLTPARLPRPSRDAAGAAGGSAAGTTAAPSAEPRSAAPHHGPRIKLTPTKLRPPDMDHDASRAAQAAGQATVVPPPAAPGSAAVSPAPVSNAAGPAPSPGTPERSAAPILSGGPSIKLSPTRMPRPLPDGSGALGTAPAAGRATEVPSPAAPASEAAGSAATSAAPASDATGPAPSPGTPERSAAPILSGGPKVKLSPTRVPRPLPDGSGALGTAPTAGRETEAPSPAAQDAAGSAAASPAPASDVAVPAPSPITPERSAATILSGPPKVKLPPTRMPRPLPDGSGAFRTAPAAGRETGTSSPAAPASDATGPAPSPGTPERSAAPILSGGPKVKLSPTRMPRPLPDGSGALGTAPAAGRATEVPSPAAPDTAGSAASSPAPASEAASLASKPVTPGSPATPARTAAAAFQKLRRNITTQPGTPPLSEAKAAGEREGGVPALRKLRRKVAPQPPADAKTSPPAAVAPADAGGKAAAVLPPQAKGVPTEEKSREAFAPAPAAAPPAPSPAAYMSADLETSAWTRSYSAAPSAPAAPENAVAAQADAPPARQTDAEDVSAPKIKVGPTRLPRRSPDAGDDGDSAPQAREASAVPGHTASSIFYSPDDLESSPWTRGYAAPRSDVSTSDRSGVPADPAGPKVKLPPTRLPRKPLEDSDVFGAKTREEAVPERVSAIEAAAANGGAAPMILGLSVDDVTPSKVSSDAEQGGEDSGTGGASFPTDKFDEWFQPHMRTVTQLHPEASALSAIARTIVTEDQPLFVLDDIREDSADADKARSRGSMPGYMRRRPNPGSLLDFVLAPEDADGEKADGDAGTDDRRDFSVTPVPGIEGEHIESAAIPLIPGLVEAIGTALRDAAGGLSEKHTVLAQEAASRLAGRAENFGLTKLGRLSRCLERAAEADDAEAAGVLLEELQLVARRYQSALQECFNSFIHYRH
ncbi:MAG: hypothetical protein LBU06_05205 [Desulfovibrio sp.]|jgi:CheY-like chemotaxis protein|nr:hypothetical protein [Desulfovibrio sp.]